MNKKIPNSPLFCRTTYGVCGAALALLMCASTTAHAAAFEVNNQSSVEFMAKITASSFVAKSEAVTGVVSYDISSGVVESATIKVDAKSFESGMDLRDDHMRDSYLEAEKFPDIVFELKDGKISGEVGKMSVLSGHFVIKGVRKAAKIKVKVTENSSGRIVAMSKFKLKITDFGIPQPKFTVVSMEPVIRVTLALVLKPKAD